MGRQLDIVEEPAGRTYADLLALASEVCASFSLVWPDELEFEPHADGIASALSEFLIREERSDRWPGTELLDHEATIRHYRISPEAMHVLQRAPGLYAWLAPDRPEDLAFYTNQGAVWLTSVAHERDGWIDDECMSEAAIHARVPGLKIVPRSVGE